MRERETIMQAIRLERLRQNEKWGVEFPGRLDERWLTILAEEVGEIAEAVLRDNDEDICEEILQTAAVCVAWLELRVERHEQDHEVQREVSRTE